MSIFKQKQNKKSATDVIRCDESSYLIWKWRPKDSAPGKSDRENAIRFGSSLRVKDGEVAVFVYKQLSGIVQDYIAGPYDGILETNNLPGLASIIGLAYGGGTPFPAEVYFVNLAQIIQVRFGVPFFDVYDSKFPDFGVPVAVRGTISFQIADIERFIKLHRLTDFTLDDFQKQIRDAVSRYIKDAVMNAPTDFSIPVIQIESRVFFINSKIEKSITERLHDYFGVLVSGVDIGAIEIDKTSDGYAQLMAVTRNLSADLARAQTQADIKSIHDRQRIEAENLSETLRIQREESQYAQRKQTQISNFAAYQVEAQTSVGVAGANAMGQMGANGVGDISSNGFNPSAMMAGMAVAGAIGQNLAGSINNVMSPVLNIPNNGNVTPPTLPQVSYYVAINGQPTGPYDLATLRQMALTGTLVKQSLVWSQGMSEWSPAESINSLQTLFVVGMPPLPQ